MNGRMERQGGWVATFVVVGALLVLGLLASAYFVKNRHDAAGKSTEQSQSSKTTDDKSSSEKSDSSKQASPSPKPTTGSSDKSSASHSDLHKSETASSSAANDDKKSQPLPHTGPKETLGSILVLGALSFLAVSYFRSRRLASGRYL